MSGNLRTGVRVDAVRWHDLGTPRSPTRADFRGRLEAIGPGRWASLSTGARVTAGPPGAATGGLRS
jgi:hypothetical protein